MNFYSHVAQWGNQLLVRAVKNGFRSNFKVRYKPTMYVPVKKETPFKSLDGKNLAPVKFDTIKESKEFIDSYESQPHLLYGLTKYPYCYITETYPHQISFDKKYLKFITIDIETQCENGFPNVREAIEPMLSITIKDQNTKEIIVWGIGEYINNRDDVTYINCKNESELLKRFVNWWSSDHPDIITGWNTEMFDVPYLCNRIKTVHDVDMMKKLSPWGIVNSREVRTQYGNELLYDILGVENLDYLQLYKKFTYTNQESYRLDNIAFVELGERKDENPYDTFKDWYTKDYQSFLDYNIKDVELVDRLDEKMKLVDLLLTMAYEAKVNLTDAYTSVKYWDILIFNHLYKQKIMIPQLKNQRQKSEKYVGAYVKEPQTGLHNWVVSFDLNSLYPHLIMQYNISPETLCAETLTIDKEKCVDLFLKQDYNQSLLKEQNVTATPNGALFSKQTQGFLPKMMQEMYNDRTIYKKKMLDAKKDYEKTKDKQYLNLISRYNNIQMARKISLNSAYGAIGNQWFRYYELLIAEGITTSGQLSIRHIENELNKYLNKILKTTGEDYVIASDTDSVYITFDKLICKLYDKGSGVQKEDRTRIINFLDTISKDKIEPFIEECYQTLALNVNAYAQKMQMKREVIADKGIWTAKKRYILNAYDVEGVRYKEPQLKIMGIEAVKSSTPAPCREKIKQALKIIMQSNEKELNTFIQQFRDEFFQLEPKEIAFPRSVNGIDKWSDSSSIYRKGSPMHIKGVILYNYLLKDRKLTHKYPVINEGEKIKYVLLKQPNRLGSNVLSFMTKLPKELNINQYIDYDTMFEKSFIEPLMFIINQVKWNIDRSYGTQSTLESFFV